MIKGFRQIAVLTLLSRVLGMVRDMTFSAFFGRSGLMDIWVIAFKVPNLARRIFGEGALASSFIPVYMEQLKQKGQSASELAGTVVTSLFVLLSSVVAIAVGVIFLYTQWGDPLLATELMVVLAGLMLPYMVLICLVAALAGILQAHRHFAVPSLAPVVLNTVIITALLISGVKLQWLPEQQLGFVAVAVLLAGVLQLVLQGLALRHLQIPLTLNWQIKAEPFRRVMWLMGPMVVGLTATQLNTLADDVVAKVFSGSPAKGEFFMLMGRTFRYPEWEGCVSSLFYSQRLYQFPLGVLGISLATAIFPVMSAEAARGDLASLNRTLARGMRGAIFVALPATAGLFLVSRPLVAAIFEQGRFTAADTPLVANTLLFYAVGLTGYFMQQLTTRAFYALQESRVPCRSALVAVSANVVLNLVLIWPLGSWGLALATALCSYLQVVMLSRALRKRLGRSLWAGMGATIWRSCLATVIMSLGGLAVLRLLAVYGSSRAMDTLRVGAVVLVAVALYWGAARVLRIESLELLRKKRV